MTERIVVASSNRGKIAEIESILAPAGKQLVPQSGFGFDDAEETGLTFVENAILKARHACSHTGLAAIADDSGLSVDALGGAPGIYSARYAGEPGDSAKNIELLLHNLEGVDDEQRTARFVCVIVLMRSADDPTPLVCEGHWQGRITRAIAGEGGFGYDPVFVAAGMDRTAAQLSATEKNSISHRARALWQLASALSP